MGSGALYVSSWGIVSLDGEDWRRFSLSWRGKRRLLVTLPPDSTTEDAMGVLLAMTGDPNAVWCLLDDWSKADG